MIPDASSLARFAADLDALVAPGAKVGVAVSGGPDSLAMLLLAAAARPGFVEAATVDHGLRPETRSEAQIVAALCGRIGVTHEILAVTVEPGASLQAQAREVRYQALAGWAADRGLGAIATAHHLDDQAETFLMRAARGSGVAGLAGVQPSRPLVEGVPLIRPLLEWRREELRRIVDAAGIQPVDDPSNRDARFDRTRVRELLASVDWLDPGRLAHVAANAADAEQALDWSASEAFRDHSARDGDALVLDPAGLPRELRRRLLLRAMAELGCAKPPGPQVMKVIQALEAGGVTTLAGLKLQGGERWRLSPAPPRRPRPFTP